MAYEQLYIDNYPITSHYSNNGMHKRNTKVQSLQRVDWERKKGGKGGRAKDHPYEKKVSDRFVSALVNIKCIDCSS